MLQPKPRDCVAGPPDPERWCPLGSLDQNQWRASAACPGSIAGTGTGTNGSTDTGANRTADQPTDTRAEWLAVPDLPAVLAVPDLPAAQHDAAANLLPVPTPVTLPDLPAVRPDSS